MPLLNILLHPATVATRTDGRVADGAPYVLRRFLSATRKYGKATVDSTAATANAVENPKR